MKLIRRFLYIQIKKCLSCHLHIWVGVHLINKQQFDGIQVALMWNKEEISSKVLPLKLLFGKDKTFEPYMED